MNLQAWEKMLGIFLGILVRGENVGEYIRENKL